MLRTNIIGSIFIIIIVFGLISFAISLRISLEWNNYFKIMGIVALVALAVSVITHIIPSKN
jgi:hypothetical protein